MTDQPTGAADSDGPAMQGESGSAPDVPSASDSGISATETSTSTSTSAADEPGVSATRVSTSSSTATAVPRGSALGSLGRFVREIVIIVAVALVASALMRAFVVQAFFVPSGSMLPEIQLHDRIVVSRIGDVERGEVVVFEDPGNWIGAAERAEPPSGLHKAMEWVGLLPASGHGHLVKRVVGLPGDHVVCCRHGELAINGQSVDESDFVHQGAKVADDTSYDVVVPADSIFVLGDNRYNSGDSSFHLAEGDATGPFVPMDLVTGRAFAVIWPAGDAHIMHVPSAYDDVPDGRQPPTEGVINPVRPGG